MSFSHCCTKQTIKHQSRHAKISAVPNTRRSLHSFNPTCVFATVVESKRFSIAAAVKFMASIADCGVTALPASSFLIISMLLRRSLCSFTACIPRGHPGSARGPYVRDRTLDPRPRAVLRGPTRDLEFLAAFNAASCYVWDPDICVDFNTGYGIPCGVPCAVPGTSNECGSST